MILQKLATKIRHIPDSITETVHKNSKSGNFLLSGGKDGESGRLDQQKRVITQAHLNEAIRIKSWNDIRATTKTVVRKLNLNTEDSILAGHSVSQFHAQ